MLHLPAPNFEAFEMQAQVLLGETETAIPGFPRNRTAFLGHFAAGHIQVGDWDAG